MVLHIHFVDCLLCRRELGRMRDLLDIDKLDEEGRLNAWRDYPLPPARFRDRIAPDICDGCWDEHRSHMVSLAYGRNRRRGCYCPPFNQIHLWAWVASKLEDEAARLGKEVQRLVPHLAQKADVGNGIVRKGPLRAYGPRKIVYRR